MVKRKAKALHNNYLAQYFKNFRKVVEPSLAFPDRI